MVRYIKGESPAPQPTTDPLLTAALALAARGVPILPLHRVVDGEGCTCGEQCKTPGKHPRGKHGSKDATTDEGQILQWWASYGKHGRLNFGQTLKGRAVVDIDVADGKPGQATWEAMLEAAFPEDPDTGVSETCHTLQYETGRGGRQLVYRLPDGEDGGKADGYAAHANALGEAVDFKTGPFQYVLVPGSKTVGVYTVTVDEAEAELPGWISELAKAAAKKTVKTIDGKTVSISGGSVLSELIMFAPDDHRRGNDWLAKIAGHYAKQYRTKKDLFLAHCFVMNAMSTDPISEAEFTKTTESIWSTEQAKRIAEMGGEDTGWLISGGSHLLVETADKDGKADVPESFANFDIQAVGVIATPGKRGRAHDVVITRKSDDEQFSDVLDVETLTNFQKLTTWFASVAGVSFSLPSRAVGEMAPHIRIMRYLEHQKAPTSRLVPQVGWNNIERVFLAPQGRIEPGSNGLQTFDGVRPRPDLPGFDRYEPPFYYGFAEGGREELRKALAKIITFHDETALRVLMSWAIGTVMRSEIMDRGNCAVFPLFAIEAVSGSGKTTGAVRMIGELTGYAMGGMLSTKADLRDKLAAFQSGFMQFDDPTDLKEYEMLLRQAPMNGTMAKRETAEHSMSAKMTGSLLITGEGLGLGHQKALMDRTVSVNLPSAAPWDYNLVKDLWAEYNGSLTNIAGTFVSEVLLLVDRLPALVKELKPIAGRAGDSYGIVRAGARALDWLLDPAADWETAKAGEGRSAAVVDAWATASIGDMPDASEDALTMKILPWAIRQFGTPVDDYGQDVIQSYKGYRPKVYPAKVREVSDDANTRTPYGAGPCIYFNASELSEVWTLKEGKHDETRLASAEAIIRQAKAVGATARPSPIALPGAKKVRYWVIEGEIAQTILDRSMD